MEVPALPDHVTDGDVIELPGGQERVRVAVVIRSRPARLRRWLGRW